MEDPIKLFFIQLASKAKILDDPEAISKSVHIPAMIQLFDESLHKFMIRLTRENENNAMSPMISPGTPPGTRKAGFTPQLMMSALKKYNDLRSLYVNFARAEQMQTDDVIANVYATLLPERYSQEVVD